MVKKLPKKKTENNKLVEWGKQEQRRRVNGKMDVQAISYGWLIWQGNLLHSTQMMGGEKKDQEGRWWAGKDRQKKTLQKGDHPRRAWVKEKGKSKRKRGQYIRKPENKNSKGGP